MPVYWRKQLIIPQLWKAFLLRKCNNGMNSWNLQICKIANCFYNGNIFFELTLVVSKNQTCNLGLIEGPSSGIEDSLFVKSQSIRNTEKNTSSSPPSGRNISLKIRRTFSFVTEFNTRLKIVNLFKKNFEISLCHYQIF